MTEPTPKMCYSRGSENLPDNEVYIKNVSYKKTAKNGEVKIYKYTMRTPKYLYKKTHPADQIPIQGRPRTPVSVIECMTRGLSYNQAMELLRYINSKYYNDKLEFRHPNKTSKLIHVVTPMSEFKLRINNDPDDIIDNVADNVVDNIPDNTESDVEQCINDIIGKEEDILFENGSDKTICSADRRSLTESKIPSEEDDLDK